MPAPRHRDHNRRFFHRINVPASKKESLATLSRSSGMRSIYFISARSMKSCGLQICSDRSGNVEAHPRGAFNVIEISYHIKKVADIQTNICHLIFLINLMFSD